MDPGYPEIRLMLLSSGISAAASQPGSQRTHAERMKALLLSRLRPLQARCFAMVSASSPIPPACNRHRQLCA